ncbi:MAG: hypothetical protein V4594_05335 [Bacteroidota bacterium]
MNELSMEYHFKRNDPRYKIMDLRGEELQAEIAKMRRHEIIEWLQWNDRNGIYTDTQSLRENGSVLTLEQGIEIMTRQIEEG